MSQLVVRGGASQTAQLLALQTTTSSSSSSSSSSSPPPPLLPQGLKNRLAQLADRAQVEGTIACYGFDKPRGELKREVTRSRTYIGSAFTMNELNRDVGIDVRRAMNVLTFFQAHRAALQGKTVAERVAFYCSRSGISTPLPDSLAGQWLHFLMEHVESVDILGTLSNLVKESEKKEMGCMPPAPSRLAYVKSSPERLKEVLVSFLKKNDKKGEIAHPQGAARALIGGLTATPPFVPKFLESALTTALFRQTSKLGLRFCAEQKIPIAFSWEQYSEGLHPTGWLSSPSPGERRVIRGFVPITGSEMRLVTSEPTIQGAVTTVQRGQSQNDFTQTTGVQRPAKLTPP